MVEKRTSFCRLAIQREKDAIIPGDAHDSEARRYEPFSSWEIALACNHFATRLREPLGFNLNWADTAAIISEYFNDDFFVRAKIASASARKESNLQQTDQKGE